jgi:hypothetical protein
MFSGSQLYWAKQSTRCSCTYSVRAVFRIGFTHDNIHSHCSLYICINAGDVASHKTRQATEVINITLIITVAMERQYVLHYVCVYVASVIQYAQCTCCIILSSVASLAPPYFSTLSL